MHVAGEAEPTPINPGSAMITSLIRKLQRCKKNSTPAGKGCLYVSLYDQNFVFNGSCHLVPQCTG